MHKTPYPPLWLLAGAAALSTLLASGPALAQDAEPHDDETEHHDDDHATEVEDVIVQATRSRRRVQDEPVRVEVINQEEIEEKLLMRPGNISMILAETGGLRMQVTSPSLGSANIRVQGMRGRYTQLLADGLPLYGGQASSLGVLQIPPSDLGRVEVIKGSASALYGGTALGGVVNLVSRRPGETAEGEFILNATTRDGQDISAYGDTPLGGGWSGSLLASANRQTILDLDDDGWADMPGYDRSSLRPRLFWQGDSGATAYLTVGGLTEQRRGGTLDGRVAPDGQPFAHDQDTSRLDAGAVFERPLGETGLFQVRASAVNQDHRHRFGDLIEKDRHRTWLAEASYAGAALGADWVAGVALQADDYASQAFPVFDYDFSAPGVFAQVERDLTENLTLAASARWDDHSQYGDFLSPRVSLLYKPGRWTVRASLGQGYYAPTPFIEETEASGLSRLEPIAGLRAEIARTASLDLAYALGPIEAGLTLFGSDIDDAVRLKDIGPDRVRLVNGDGVTRTRGAEMLLRYRRAPFTVTGSYVHVHATEPDPTGPGRRSMPLTPKDSLGLVAVWEEHDRGRIGLEAYYTGKQPLDDNPYRSESRPYLQLGALGEIVLGRYRLFLNFENLLDVRQTKYDRLTLPVRAPDGSWTVDAWAPLEGFTANAGVRLRFGG